MTENEISYKIRGSIFTVANNLGPGLLESVYQKVLSYQLMKDGLHIKEQMKIPIVYDGVKIGEDLVLDILVEDKVVVELKSVTEFKEVHYKQLYTYLKLSGKKLGLLVNFNSSDISKNIKRVVNNL